LFSSNIFAKKQRQSPRKQVETCYVSCLHAAAANKYLFGLFNAGSTKDIGSALTRICVRQKMVENKLKQFTK